METPQITLTDAKPVPKDRRCPQCRAGEDARASSGTFGAPAVICLQCGYQFPQETPRG